MMVVVGRGCVWRFGEVALERGIDLAGDLAVEAAEYLALELASDQGRT